MQSNVFRVDETCVYSIFNDLLETFQAIVAAWPRASNFYILIRF